MTWEQEMKEQAHFLAEELAPIMAKDMAKDIAKDLAKVAKSEGQTEKAIETAKNLFELNLTPAQIAKATSLPLEQVLQLQKEVTSSVAK